MAFRGGAIFVIQQAVRRIVVGESLSPPIPFQKGFGLESDICQQSRCGAAMTGFDIAIAFGAALDAIKEISRMQDRVAAIALDGHLLRLDQWFGIGTITAVRPAIERRAGREFIL